MYLSPTTHGETIKRTDAGRFVLYQSTYAPRTKLPRHYHAFAAVMFSVRQQFTEDLGGRSYACGALDVLIRPPEEVHTDRYDAGGVCVVVNVSAEGLDGLGNAASLFTEPSILPRSRVGGLAARISEELGLADEASPLVVEGLVLEMIGEGLRRPKQGRAPGWLVHACDFIDSHADERIGLREIAAAADVHPSTLVRAFRAHFNMSPGDYVRRVRIDRSKEALVQTDDSLASIAAGAGFYDQSHFANVFRQVTAMTPGQWRKSFRC